MAMLEQSKQYYFEAADHLLKSRFPDLYPRLAVGLVGNGSECFGFDDEYSFDHDCGVDFYLWVQEADRAALEDLQEFKSLLLIQNPPFKVARPSGYARSNSICTVEDFYKQYIGVSRVPQTIGEWTQAPEENFALVTNGEVWLDGPGEFSDLRNELLLYYPEDLRKKRMAAACMEIAQTGQYNHLRMGKRRDVVALRLTLARFCEAVVSLVFMLNKVYKPYYKWAYKSMCTLPLLGAEVAEPLKHIALFSGTEPLELQQQQQSIDELCAQLIKELQRQGLSKTDELFMTAQGEEIQQSIKRESLRNLPVQLKL